MTGSRSFHSECLNKSTDYGKSFDKFHNGIMRALVVCVAAAPSQPGTVFIDISGEENLKVSHDSGTSWQFLATNRVKCSGYPTGCGPSIYQLLVNSKGVNDLLAMESG